MCQEGRSAQDPSGKIIAPWTFSIKFPYNTQFTFGSLMFATWEDGNLEFAPVYGHAPYLPSTSSTPGGACSGLNPHASSYHRATKTTQGIPIRAPILQPSAGTSSSSTSIASPDQDSTDDYPKIEGSTCWNSADEGHLIIMVPPAGAPSHNSSSRYPTIGGSEASNARNDSNFNVVRLQTIIESIQCMAPKGSPFVSLA
jgi:hypothetical protein